MEAFKWLFSQAGEKKSELTMSVILAILSSLAGACPYFVIVKILENLLNGNRDIKTYAVLCLLSALFWILSSAFHALSTASSHKATFHILCVLRKKTLDKLARMPLGDVLNKGTGSLKSTIMERIDAMETPLAHILPEFTAGLITPLIIVIIIFTMNWKMGLISLITLPLGMACYMGMMIGYEASYTRAINATKNLNDTTVEYINGIQVIKVFGKTQSSYEKFVLAAKEGANAYIDWMRSCIGFHAFALRITPNTLISVLPLGTLLYMHGTISEITLISVIILSIGLITPLVNCMSYSDDIATLGTTVKEVREILDAKELERPQTLQEEIKDASIKLENVHFSYGEKEVLHGINMDIPQGSYVALVGPSGSGKSTIARLIAQLWDIDEGKISFGNVDTKQIPLDLFNKRVSYVSQNNYLFDQSVKDNIRMGADREVTDEEVIDIAKKAGCHDFIMNLENGYETIVGSSGGHLSGGERQRISIARAMMKDPDVIILDEATAYTDPESEALIQRSISKLVKGKTLIVIAHRLSTIKDADKIYVIQNGNIAEEGKHEALLKENGLYKTMWDAHINVKDGGEGTCLEA